MRNVISVVTLLVSALFAQQAPIASIPNVSAVFRTAPDEEQQIVVTNGTTKTITAIALASEFSRTLVNSANSRSLGGLMRATVVYDAAITPRVSPIAPGTTVLSVPFSKDATTPFVVAAVYADGSGVGDQKQLSRIASLRQAMVQNLKLVIADTQTAIAAKTAADFSAIMVTKVKSITSSASALASPARPAIDSTYGDLSRLHAAYGGKPFQVEQSQALLGALSNFQKRLAILQQLVPGL